MKWNGLELTKTEYTTLVEGDVYTGKIRRVWADPEGRRYVKINGQLKCIENTPCIYYMVKD